MGKTKTKGFTKIQFPANVTIQHNFNINQREMAKGNQYRVSTDYQDVQFVRIFKEVSIQDEPFFVPEVDFRKFVSLGWVSINNFAPVQRKK